MIKKNLDFSSLDLLILIVFFGFGPEQQRHNFIVNHAQSSVDSFDSEQGADFHGNSQTHHGNVGQVTRCKGVEAGADQTHFGGDTRVDSFPALVDVDTATNESASFGHTEY